MGNLNIFDVISKIADIMTILGLSSIPIYGIIFKYKNQLGNRIFRFSLTAFRFGLFILVWIIGINFSMFLYAVFLALLKGVSTPFYWEPGKELQHIIAYLVTGLIMVGILFPISMSIASFSLFYIHQFISKLTGGLIPFDKNNYPRFAKLEIIKGLYGANTSFVNVTHILRAMVEDGQIHVQASNSLAGDPIWGVPKTLQVTYKLNDIENSVSIPEGGILEIPICKGM